MEIQENYVILGGIGGNANTLEVFAADSWQELQGVAFEDE
jgi:hypothetical protein